MSGNRVCCPLVSIHDGDTVEVLRNSHDDRTHLHGVYCPGEGEAFGKRAKQAATELIFRRQVALQTYDEDMYRRTLADGLLLDGTNVNRELGKEGWCWWYRRYAPGNTLLEGLENEAREAKKGLWNGPQPVPPWEWRKRSR